MPLDHIRITRPEQRDKLFQQRSFLRLIRGIIDHEDFLPSRTVAQRNGQKRITRRLRHGPIHPGVGFDIDLHPPQIFKGHPFEQRASAGE